MGVIRRGTMHGWWNGTRGGGCGATKLLGKRGFFLGGLLVIAEEMRGERGERRTVGCAVGEEDLGAFGGG